MAGSLVDSLARRLQPDEYDDTYRERVVEMIEAKAKGKQVVQRRGRTSRPRSPTCSPRSKPA